MGEFRDHQNLIIGDDNCRYRDITEILVRYPTVFENWKAIHERLDLSPVEIISLNYRLANDGTFTPRDLFTQILRLRRSTAGRAATLGHFIAILRNLQLTECAETLEETFGKL